jgi:hypothetical protein
LKNSARRTVGGAKFSLDKPRGQKGVVPSTVPAGVPRDDGGALPRGQAREAGQVAEGGMPLSPASAEKRAVETEREEDTSGDTEIAGAPETIREVDEDAECDFDELKLDEAHEKAIENLREEEEVLVLVPAKEFVIAHGPKRTVLYWLCGDAEMTVKINDFLEGEPQRTGLPLTPTCLVSHH